MTIITQYRKRLLYSLLIFSALFCAVSPGALSQALPPEPQSDLPFLSKLLGGAQQQADFIVAVDRSRSMKNYWPLVKHSVADFVDAVPNKDYISILYFESRAGELLTPLLVSDNNRSSIKDHIRSLPDPPGDNTDLGFGLDRILDELNRPNSNRLQFVFMFTDFVHEPLDTSKWASLDCASPAWRQLAEKKKRLIDNDNHIVKFYALELPLDRRVGRDIRLVDCIFGGIEKVSVDGPGLRAWFERRRQEILRDKLRIQAEMELLKGGLHYAMEDTGSARISKGRTATLRLKLSSTYRIFELSGVVSFLQTEATDGFRIECGQPTFNLRPGSAADIVLTLRSIQSDNSWIPRSVPFRLKLVIDASYSVLPENELKILNLEPGGRLSEAFIVDGQLRSGPSRLVFWTLVVLLGVAVAAGGKASWDKYKPEYLHGILQDEQRPPGADSIKVTFRRRDRKSVVTVGHEGSSGSYDISLKAGENPTGIRLLATRKPKRGIYFQWIEGVVGLDGVSVSDYSMHRLQQGKNKIELCGYILKWK